MLINKVCLNKLYNVLFFMNWIRFTNRLFGARIQINEPGRVQFETNEPHGSRTNAGGHSPGNWGKVSEGFLRKKSGKT